jgi:hypothetical protein
MAGKKESERQPQPREDESLAEASKEAVRELERRHRDGADTAGAGDIG